MKDNIIKKLGEQYVLEKIDMGDLSHIHKGMYDFICEAYEIKDIGSLFFINMKAMFGLMRMETSVITPLNRDLSFCNLDIVEAMGNETYMFEMYKSAINDPDLSAFDDIRKKYEYLTDYKTSERWYDAVKLSPSIAKKGKKIGADGDKLLTECLDTYLKLLKDAPKCDPDKKKAEVRKYVDRLIAEGGAAVDSMNKIIGAEKTAKLIREFMYHIN